MPDDAIFNEIFVWLKHIYELNLSTSFEIERDMAVLIFNLLINLPTLKTDLFNQIWEIFEIIKLKTLEGFHNNELTTKVVNCKNANDFNKLKEKICDPKTLEFGFLQ